MSHFLLFHCCEACPSVYNFMSHFPQFYCFEACARFIFL